MANPRIRDSLGDVVNGKLSGIIYNSLPPVRTARFSLNVHAPEGPYPVLACGDLPRS